MPAVTLSLARRTVGAFALVLASTACTITAPTRSLDGREVRLTLLHTSDWHSRLFPYNQAVTVTDTGLGLQQSNAPFGGAARMNWLIQRERAHADRVLHLDSGDCFQGAPIFNFFSGEAEVRALAHTGVDGVVVGNHEFDRGAFNFGRQYSRWATFPVLAANYLFDDPTTPGSPELGRIARPYHVYDVQGLRVAVIGFGNLSSITSIFDQPNRTGITPLNTVEVAQFYLDTVRAQGADVVVGLTHIGLDEDVRMIHYTEGFDVVLGGHLHIVLNPTQEVTDCLPEDDAGNHFIPQLTHAGAVVDPLAPGCNPATDCCSAFGACPPEGNSPSRAWRLRPGYQARYCTPRTVLLQHSGAFMKYLGRLDLTLSNDPSRFGVHQLSDAGIGAYQGYNRFEVLNHTFTLFPVDSTVAEEPTMAQLLEPYGYALNRVANLDTLVGYSPNGVSRTNDNGGDSPMGNLVTAAMQLRLGVQTDFALTNTLGIRDSIPAGPVSIDQIYNVFPFDNSITTLQLSGREVRELFDFVARRSSGRGCNSQAQISGARVVIQCGGCDRDGSPGLDPNSTACAATINIGLRADGNNQVIPCVTDADCNPTPPSTPEGKSLCDPRSHACMLPLLVNGSYSLAANDYIAGGGSGFFVLQRNTTQVNTYVQLRDALVDVATNGNPCGYDPGAAMTYRQMHPGQAQHGDDGLPVCMRDADCANGFVCSCPDRFAFDASMRTCGSTSCAGETGRCVLSDCRDGVSALVARRCPTVSPANDPAARDRCLCSAAARASETCRILSCFDDGIGASSDGRLHMETVQ